MKISIKVNPFSEKTRSAAQALISQLTDLGAAVRLQEQDASLSDLYARLQDISDDSDLLLSLGGDGTLLTAGRYAVQAGLPVLGVNLGRFGFLTELSLQEVHDWAGSILKKRYQVQQRIVLEARVDSGPSYIAVNEFVLREPYAIKTTYLSFAIADEWFEEIPADAVIVATPTGSTAYNLSAGGSILLPEMQAIIFSLICPHILNFRPIVLTDRFPITVRADKPLSMVADGQFPVEVPTGSRVHIFVHDRRLQLARVKNLSFPEILKRKFGWGIGRSQDNEG